MKIYLSFIIIGLGIGWLAGLSLSPVISTVISALLALVASSMAFLTNLNFKKEDKVQVAGDWIDSIVFMAFLMLGIVAGSSAGIYAREHNVLGVSLEKRAEIIRDLAGKNREKEWTNLKSDIESFKEILDANIKNDNIEKKILQEFIQKRMLSLTSAILPSDSSEQLSSQYGKSGLYSDKKELCEFLLNQPNRVISLIDINNSDEKYSDLVDLLSQLREKKLSNNEITTQVQQHLEEKCP